MSFNQREYINNYKKKHYAKLSVDLRKEDKEKLAEICKEQGITIKQFILQAINKQVEQENKKLKERIEYLERSNNRREDTILEQRQEISDLEDKIDKAINNSQYWIDYYTRLNSDERIALRLQENIDILKEVSE